MRSVRSRDSRTSTQPVIAALGTKWRSTGWAIQSVLTVAVAKPAAAAANPRTTGSPTGLARHAMVAPASAPKRRIGAHSSGSRGAVK